MIVEVRILGVFLVTMVAFVGCGSDSKPETLGTGGAPGNAPEAGSGSHDPVPFNGDCSAAKWANVTDECWACLCGACKETLDSCNEDCTDIFACAKEKRTLVDVASDINCELRATGNLCLQTPAAQAATMALVTFDSCLIGAATKPVAGEFRACDTVCKTPYSGDVCQRFPM
jgi:hypothetical protein